MWLELKGSLENSHRLDPRRYKDVHYLTSYTVLENPESGQDKISESQTDKNRASKIAGLYVFSRTGQKGPTPYSTDIMLYKPRRPKCFFILKSS